jgi:hypothetical protein
VRARRSDSADLTECGNRRRSIFANANQQTTALDGDQQKRLLTAERQTIENVDPGAQIGISAAEGTP